jgi:GNAT superfamily N-acetyltransferase
VTDERFQLRQIQSAEDPDLRALSALMNATFPDPNTVLGLDRMQEFLTANEPTALRQFCVLVATDTQRSEHPVVGGSVFSHVVKSNCGFSEYILADHSVRGLGVGRRLFDRRKSVLDAQAHRQGQDGCHGVFIEVDNPERIPADLAELEGGTALDVRERLRIFDHLGFRRVEAPYVQPPLAADKVPIDYMDLLFAPWDAHVSGSGRIPAQWLFDTVEAVWSAWTPETFSRHLDALRHSVEGDYVQLRSAT